MMKNAFNNQYIMENYINVLSTSELSMSFY